MEASKFACRETSSPQTERSIFAALNASTGYFDRINKTKYWPFSYCVIPSELPAYLEIPSRFGAPED